MALYRLPSAEMVKESSLGRLSCVTKRRPPLSHMISLFIKDTTTSEPPAPGPHLPGAWAGLFSSLLGQMSTRQLPKTSHMAGIELRDRAGMVAVAEDGTLGRMGSVVPALQAQLCSAQACYGEAWIVPSTRRSSLALFLRVAVLPVRAE